MKVLYYNEFATTFAGSTYYEFTACPQSYFDAHNHIADDYSDHDVIKMYRDLNNSGICGETAECGFEVDSGHTMHEIISYMKSKGWDMQPLDFREEMARRRNS